MTTATPESSYRIFVSAPEDVAVESDLVARVCAEIADEFHGRVTFVAEGTSPDAAVEQPAAADLVICLLWKGLGQTLPASFDRADGTPRTGIEFEFEEALASALKRRTPDILVYKKRVLIDAEQADAAAAELRALNAFWQKWFRNEHGHFTASFDGFETTDEFAEKLRRHLRQWLLRRRQDVTWPIELKGSPYRSLEPFEADHAGVFFGRRLAVRQVVAKLAAAAAQGCGFLLVLGGSGTGKSSLVRAGVIPWLIEHGVVPDIAGWRSASVRPASLGDDPVVGLVRALFDALPGLTESDYPNPERFATLAVRSAEAATIIVSGTLRGANPARETRLILLIDQLEELLARPADVAANFIILIDALARSGRVWVIGTLRSDRYPEFQTAPGLLRLKEDGAAFDLLPPDPAEIQDIIEGPARAAGLTLEEAGGRGLSALLEEASRERGALPLLQFTLHRLFLERDAGTGTMLLATYDSLGGLAGAIAGEAERTVSALGEGALAALPRLLINLVEIAEGKESVSARLLRVADIADPDVKLLADRLVEHRFLALDVSGSEATLRLAHEALLARWPRLADLVGDQRAFLATRSRLGIDSANWLARERHADFLLPSGRRLAEAADALSRHRFDLGPDTIAYIEASLEADRQRVAEREAAERRALQMRAEAAEQRALAARRLVRRTRIAAIFVSVLLLGMIGIGFLWFNQRQLAQARAMEAEKNYATALKAASDGVNLVAAARLAGQLPIDVAGELLDATHATFDQLSSRDQSSEVMAIRAQLFDQIAQQAYLAGKFGDALDAIQQELTLTTALTARQPGDEKYQWGLAHAHESLGQWLEQAGDLPAAAKEYASVMSIADAMIAKTPTSPVWQGWKSAALNHRADIIRAEGDLPKAIALYRDVVARFIAALAANGSNPFSEYQVAQARIALARALLSQGDVAGALEQRRAALETFKAQANVDKSNRNWRFLEALENAELGDTLRVHGDQQAALDAFQESASIELTLTNSDKTNFLVRNNAAASRRGRADVLLDQNNTDEALKLYRTVIETIASLAEKDPNNSFWQRNLGQMHGRVGDAILDTHDIAAAEKEYRASIEITERLAKLDPTNTDWQRELSLSHMRLGALLRAKGDDSGALVQDQRSLEILERLTKQDPTNIDWRRDLGAIHGRLGQVLTAQGDQAAAHDQFAACASVPKPERDTDTVYNRHEDMHDICVQMIAATP